MDKNSDSLLYYFYNSEKWNSEKLSNLPEVSQLVSIPAGFGSDTCWIQFTRDTFIYFFSRDTFNTKEAVGFEMRNLKGNIVYVL